jgi:hypothetical protein
MIKIHHKHESGIACDSTLSVKARFSLLAPFSGLRDNLRAKTAIN